MKGVPHVWNFKGEKMLFPAKGLYTLAKVKRDLSSCASYEIEVQAFMCHVLRGGNPVREPASPPPLQQYETRARRALPPPASRLDATAL